MNGNGMIYLISFTLRQLQLGPHACLLVGVCYMQYVVLEFLGYWGSGVPRYGELENFDTQILIPLSCCVVELLAASFRIRNHCLPLCKGPSFVRC